jgi:trimethylamine--corrinoid protein Co-methyltransferase
MKYIQSSIEILTASEIEQIHRATLEVLATVGCRMPHPRVQALLEKQGAQVDECGGGIRFPEQLIERAVCEVQKGEHNPSIKPFRRHPFRIHPGNQATIIDFQAKHRRPGTTEDVLKGIVVCNELPYVSLIMPVVIPADVHAAMSDLYAYYLCSLYAQKPYFVYIYSPDSARQVLRIWEIVKHEPARAEFPSQVGYLLEPNGALSFDRHSLEMTLIFAED